MWNKFNQNEMESLLISWILCKVGEALPLLRSLMHCMSFYCHFTRLSSLLWFIWAVLLPFVPYNYLYISFLVLLPLSSSIRNIHVIQQSQFLHPEWLLFITLSEIYTLLTMWRFQESLFVFSWEADGTLNLSVGDIQSSTSPGEAYPQNFVSLLQFIRKKPFLSHYIMPNFVYFPAVYRGSGPECTDVRVAGNIFIIHQETRLLPGFRN
jgi:hypothetical protein